MQIKIYEKVSMMPNGDRDTRTHPSSAFKVVLINGDRKTTIFKNDQYDGFSSSIQGTRDGYLHEANEAANSLAETLGGAEILGVAFTKLEMRAEELRANIKRDTQELAEIERKIR